MPFDELISVIVPVYNAENTIRRCLDSIVQQTYVNLDIVVVDDGSTDASGRICDEYADSDRRIRVLHKPNGGVSSARNEGLAAAKGEYIAWLDSDDQFLPTIIEKLHDALKRHNKKIAMCNYANARENGRQVARYQLDYGEKEYPRETAVSFILCIKFVPVLWANLMARELYDGITFPEGRIFEDILNTYRLYERADGCVFLSEVLLIRHVLRSSICHIKNLLNRIDGCKAYIERYQDAVTRWPQLKQDMLIANARHLRILRNNVLKNALGQYGKCRNDVREICAFYREHTEEILPSDAGPLWRAEYRLVTSGTFMGFAVSMLIDLPSILLGKPYGLTRLKPKSLPPY